MNTALMFACSICGLIEITTLGCCIFKSFYDRILSKCGTTIGFLCTVSAIVILREAGFIRPSIVILVVSLVQLIVISKFKQEGFHGEHAPQEEELD